MNERRLDRASGGPAPETAPSGARTLDTMSLEFDASAYMPIAELGRGGMADVYLAVRRGRVGLRKLVVLKALRSDLASDARLQAMFLDEARLGARLNHPNIVQTYEVDVAGGRPFLILEFLDGQSLAQMRQRLDARSETHRRVLVRVLIEALVGLHHAHELRGDGGAPLDVVHRDVTPSNVFVTYDGHTKILDFGIAKAADRLAQTHTGDLKGTVRYMAPEVVTGEAYDRRADLYAVGVILWELLLGVRMWDGLAEPAMLLRITSTSPPSPRDVDPSIPPALDAACMRALARDPSARFATAAEMADALEAYLTASGPAVGARQVGAVLRERFERERTTRKRSLDAKLTRLQDDTAAHAGLVSLAATVLGAEEAQAALRRSEAPPRSSRLWAVASSVSVASLVALGVVGLAAFRVGAPLSHAATVAAPPPSSPPSPSSPVDAPPLRSAAPPAEADAAPSRITLHVAVTPATARVTIDGRPVTGDPARVAALRDGRMHTIAASAPGFAARSVQVVFAGDASVAIALPPAHDAPKRRRDVDRRLPW